MVIAFIKSFTIIFKDVCSLEVGTPYDFRKYRF
jgi:hypothetical protein